MFTSTIWPGIFLQNQPLQWLNSGFLSAALLALLLLMILLHYVYRRRVMQNMKCLNDAIHRSEINRHTQAEVEHPYLTITPDSFVRMNAQGDYLDVHYGHNAPFVIPPTGMIGRNIYEVLPKVTADTIMEKVKEAITTKQVVHYEYERELLGDTYYIESRILAKNENEIFAFIRDVTEQHQRDAMLRHQAHLVDSVSDVIIAVDKDMRITGWNRAATETYGYPSEEVIGKHLDTVLKGEYRNSTMADVLAVIEEEGVWLGEQRHHTKDGRSFSFSSSISPIYDSQSAPIGLVAVSRNITEQKRTEQLLPMAQQSESMKTVVGGIAHDFNNLLTGILSYTSLATDQLPTESMASSYLEKARSAIERAADLTRQLLAFTGQGAYIVEPLDLNQMIHDNSGLLEVILPADVKLSLSLAKTIPAIEMDRGHAQQIIMNLLINAGEALNNLPGEISVQTDIIQLQGDEMEFHGNHVPLPPGDYVQLAICDSGNGMDARTIQRIFEPYFTTKPDGSGLGLAATMGIVNRYGGGIRVHSEIGKGTEFVLVFPAATIEKRLPESQSLTSQDNNMMDAVPHTVGHSSEAIGNILIIDDDSVVLETFGEILSTNGFQVFLAENGYEGVACYQTHQQSIDLAMIDMKMPGMNGIQTIAALREFDPDLKVILCSGYSESEVHSNLNGESVTAFLQKPIRIAELITSIKSVLGSAEL